MPRVSDAQCLAAHAACDNRIRLMHDEAKHDIVIIDVSKPANERELWRGPDSDPGAGEIQFTIACWRPCVEAALNIN